MVFTSPLSTWRSAQVYLGKAHFSFWFVWEYQSPNPHLMAWIVGLWQLMQKIDWYEELVWMLDGAIWLWADCLNKTVWQQAEVSGMSIPVWVTSHNLIAPSFVTSPCHSSLCVGLDMTSRMRSGKPLEPSVGLRPINTRLALSCKGKSSHYSFYLNKMFNGSIYLFPRGSLSQNPLLHKSCT